MHIVLDCRSIHAHMGGIGQAAWGLAEALGVSARGHRVTLIIGCNLPSGFRVNNVTLLQVDAGMIDEHFEQIGLPAALEDLHADVYANTTFSLPALKTTTREVSFIHDVVFEDHPEWVEPRLRDYLRRWARFAAHEADRIVTVSHHARSRIVAVYGVDPQRVRVICNGLRSESHARPPDDQIIQARGKHNLSGRYVLYIGALEPKKGIAELLEAFALLSRTEPDIRLALVGAPGCPGFDADAMIRETGCSERILRLGYLPEEEKRALLAGCDLFVYPSHYEGFGLPPLEALGLGVPCVVNDAASLPEVVGDHALKVDVHDTDAFTAALSKGLHDSAFRSFAQTLGPGWAKEFTWRRAADEFLDLCETLGT